MLSPLEKRILLFSLLIKFVLALFLPLFPDEAYYWVWSHHLQLSYFDHPPFIAWLLTLGHPLENILQAVRWPAVIFGHLTLILWLIYLKNILSPRERIFWLMAMLLNPLTGPGSFILTPDLPLMVFWASFVVVFSRWLQKPQPKRALLLGTQLGLGFLSKYHMALAAPIMLIELLLKKLFQKALKHLPLVFIGFLFFSAPIWIWNAQNDWISIKFQLSHGLSADKWSPSWPLDYVLSQVLIASPFFIWWAFKNKKAPSLLHLLAWTPLVFFFLTSFKGRTEANWPVVAYPALFALAIQQAAQNQHRLIKKILGAWIGIFILLYTYVLFPWATYWEPLDRLNLKKYKEMAQKTASYSPLYAKHFRMASELSFLQKRMVYKLRNASRFDFFDTIPQSIPTSPHFFFITFKGFGLPPIIQEKGYHIMNRQALNSRYDLLEVSL